MRQLKFRLWSAGKFHYWGFMDDAFRGIPQTNEPMSMEEAEKRSQQFTGLLDKNSKEIYEGDIISWTNPRTQVVEAVCEVRWSIGEAKFIKLEPKTKYCRLYDWHTMEVIGNIYLNKELLNEA